MTIQFQEFPLLFRAMKEQIKDKVIQKIYSNFNFLYFPYFLNESENDVESNFLMIYPHYIEEYIFYYLGKYKFISYQIFKTGQHISNEDKNCEKLFPQKVFVVLCVESKCLIIEKIDFSCINKIIEKLKLQKTFIIRAKEITRTTDLYQKFADEISNNKFVEMTISSIIGYLIERYSYPSNFFKDSTFFCFNKQEKSKETEIKDKIYKILTSDNDEEEENENVKQLLSLKMSNKEKYLNVFREFKKDDFIILKTIYSNDRATFYLVIHIDTLYLFIMKMLNDSIDEKIKKREIEFCKKYPHRCFTKFYGFIRNEHTNNITGIIYEYMSNDSIHSHILVYKKPITYIYVLLTIIRIFRAIVFLQENLLIHRDLKPLNILIDHDFIPHIADFETIRNVEGNEITNDIGSLLYSSPEQNKSENVSFPTDIYSFGFIVYFLNEKKHHDNSLKKQYCSMPKNMQTLFEGCTKFLQEERLKIKQIKELLIEEIDSFFMDKNKLEDQILEANESEIIQLLFEIYQIQEQSDKFIDIIMSIKPLFLSKIRKENSISLKQSLNFSFQKKRSEAFLFFGNLYENGYGVIKDYNKAKEFYEMSAELNNSDALLFLGNLYFNGYGVKSNFSKALKFYEKSADQNNCYALTFLGNYYLYHNNYFKAKKYFKKLAEKNDSKALLKLGIFYLNGYGVKQNYLKAIYYFILSSEQNNSDAFLCLGNLYFRNYDLENNFNIAIDYYEKSARLHNENAMLILGNIFLGGYINEDFVSAKKYYDMLIEKNNSIAHLKLGIIFEDGLGVEKDYIKAKFHYEQSAKLNNSDAILFLGNLYFNGVGVKRDFLQAKEYYQKFCQKAQLNTSLCSFDEFYNDYFCSMQKSYLDIKNIYEIAIYQNDLYSLAYLEFYVYIIFAYKQDYIKARQYYEKLAELNNTDAIMKLASFYENGYGVEQNYIKARQYYEKLAQQNNDEAIMKLASFYENGYGVEHDYIKAKQYYEKLAQQNNDEAVLKLALLYINGKGVKQNYFIAKKLLEKLAFKNNLDALYELGDLYYKGCLGDENKSTGLYYFESAAEPKQINSILFLGFTYCDLKNEYDEEFVLKGKKYLEEASKLCIPIAFQYIGMFYFNIGVNNDENIYKGLEYLELGGQLNDAESYYYLGCIYGCGDKIESDIYKAIKYFELAAQLNHIDSLILLGEIYKENDILKDLNKYIYYYDLATQLGSDEALYQLGTDYYHGYDCEIDYTKSRNYLEKLVQLPKTESYYDGMFLLGEIYFNGYGVPINIKKALQYYEKEGLNHTQAIYRIAYIYYNGYGVEKDYKKAKQYFEQLTDDNYFNWNLELGDIYYYGYGTEKNLSLALLYYNKSNKDEAKLKIGKILTKGDGIQSNYAQAIEYFKYLEKNKNAKALINLGIMYRDGTGVQQNYKEAKKYFELAAD